MSDDEVTVFYSWQSDSRETRNYIEKHLKSALKEISSNPDLEMSPRMDKDTQGMTGAVEIAKTILKKIDRSGIFLADVSIIGKSDEGRFLANQNVLFELGYAVAKLGDENIILVANSDTGDIDKLPFDIRGRRIAAFSIMKDPKGKQFSHTIKEIIKDHLKSLKKSQNSINATITTTGIKRMLINNDLKIDSIKALLDEFVVNALDSIDRGEDERFSLSIDSIYMLYKHSTDSRGQIRPNLKFNIEELFHEILVRLPVLGGKCIEQGRYDLAKDLVLKKPIRRAGVEFGNWYRHLLTASARAKLLIDKKTNKPQNMLQQTKDFIDSNDDVSKLLVWDSDELKYLPASFDLVASVFILDAAEYLSSDDYYTSFAIYSKHEIEPYLAELVRQKDELIVSDDGQLADIIRMVDVSAQQETFVRWRIGGWNEKIIRDLLSANAKKDKRS